MPDDDQPPVFELGPVLAVVAVGIYALFFLQPARERFLSVLVARSGAAGDPPGGGG